MVLHEIAYFVLPLHVDRFIAELDKRLMNLAVLRRELNSLALRELRKRRSEVSNMTPPICLLPLDLEHRIPQLGQPDGLCPGNAAAR
jgi:hypothetical protein